MKHKHAKSQHVIYVSWYLSSQPARVSASEWAKRMVLIGLLGLIAYYLNDSFVLQWIPTIFLEDRLPYTALRKWTHLKRMGRVSFEWACRGRYTFCMDPSLLIRLAYPFLKQRNLSRLLRQHLVNHEISLFRSVSSLFFTNVAHK